MISEVQQRKRTKNDTCVDKHKQTLCLWKIE